MKEFLGRVLRASGEQWFLFFVLSFVVAIGVTIITALNADHIVRCYYPQTSSTSAGLAYKIKGDIDWADDITSFTTLDGDKALSVLSNLKQCGK